jgi:hypothetical protein
MKFERLSLRTTIAVVVVVASTAVGSLLSQWLVTREANRKSRQERFQSCRLAVKEEREFLLDAVDGEVRKARRDLSEFKSLFDSNSAAMKARVDSASVEVARAQSELRTFRNVSALMFAEGLRLAVGKYELKKAEFDEHQEEGNASLEKLKLAVAKAESNRDALIDAWRINSIDSAASNRMVTIWGKGP